MIRTGRKPSSDPNQERLRQEKTSWNKDVSSFINDLIHLKKMMNGWPSKFHKERSRIIDPIPADPASILGVLSSDFQDLAQRGNRIVQQQMEYSKNRKKKQPKQLSLPLPAPTPTTTAPAAPPASTPAPDLTKQLTLPLTASLQDEIAKFGSNPITRFFARILNPAIGSSPAARIRKYRMSLLTASVNLYKDINKLQGQVIKSSPESIFTSIQILSKIESQWVFIVQGFKTYKASMPSHVPNTGGNINIQKPSDTPTPAEQPSPASPQTPDIAQPSSINNMEFEQAKMAALDFRRNIANFLDLNTKRLNSLVIKFSNAPDETTKKEIAPQLLMEYRSVLAGANAKYGTNGITLKEILEARAKNASLSNHHMESLAQNFVSKWFGKLKHQLTPFDKTSAFRLDIYKLCDVLNKEIDKAMDSLEKDMNVVELENLFNKIETNILVVRELMRSLQRVLEHETVLSDVQKQRLQKLIEQRQLRELTNLYMAR